MAREYARIGTGIWAEPSILALTPLEQRAYLLLYTQPELSRCGVAPYTLRRWAGLSKGDTVTKLRAAFRGLERRRHVILDETTEEALARTYVRHDGLLTQPQVVGAMVRDYRTIRSQCIRTAFLAELRRIWHLQLSDSERRGLRIALGVVETDKQKEAIGDGLADPMLQAIQQGSVQPFAQGLLEGLPEGLAKALARPAFPGPGPGPGPDSGPSPSPGVVGEIREEVEVELPREAALR